MNLQESYVPSGERSVRRRILRSAAVHLYRHPYLALAVLIALTAGAFVRAGRLEIQEDLRAFSPRKPAQQAVWDSLALVSPRFDPVAVIVRFPKSNPVPKPDARDALAALFVDSLSDWSVVTHVEEQSPPPQGIPEIPLTYAQMLLRLRPGRPGEPGDLASLRELATPLGAQAALHRVAEALAAPDSPPDWTALDPSDPLGILAQLEERKTLPATVFPPALEVLSPVQPDERTIVLRLAPRHAASSLFYCIALHRFLTETATVLAGTEEGRAAGSFDVDFSGRHVDTARRAIDLRDDLARGLVVFLICTVLLILLAFRKAEALLFVGLPPLVGLVWTYGLASYLGGSLHVITALFPVLLGALGVEFTMQIYNRFIEELYRERRYYPALGAAYAEAGRGVLVSALLVGAVFLSLRWSGFGILRELGLVCGVSVLCMALAPLLLLPPMAALKSRLAKGNISPIRSYDFGLKRLSVAITASPRTTVTLGLLITVYLAFHTRQISISREAGLDLMAPEVAIPAQDAPEAVAAPSVGQALSIIVEGATLDEALGHNDRLYTNLLNLPKSMALDTICSISPALPSPTLQSTIAMGVAGLDIEAIERALKSASGSAGMEPDRFAPFVATLIGLQRYATQAEPLSLAGTDDADFAALARNHIVHANGVFRILTSVVPSPGTRDILTTRFRAFTRELERGGFERGLLYDSEAIQNRRVGIQVVRTMALTVFFSVLWLAVCIVPHFHGRLVDSVLALLPLSCAMIWTFGVLIQMDFHPGLYSLLILPLVMGIAMDQTIVLIQRLYDRRYGSLRRVVRAGARPGLVAGLMHLIGFGCLVQVRFPALQEMAGVALLALVFSSFATILLVPALLQIRQEGGLSAFAAGEEG